MGKYEELARSAVMENFPAQHPGYIYVLASGLDEIIREIAALKGEIAGLRPMVVTLPKAVSDEIIPMYNPPIVKDVPMPPWYRPVVDKTPGVE